MVVHIEKPTEFSSKDAPVQLKGEALLIWQVFRAGITPKGSENLYFIKEIYEDVDIYALQKSINTLINNHDILKMRIREGGGESYYDLIKSFEPKINFHDMTEIYHESEDELTYDEFTKLYMQNLIRKSFEFNSELGVSENLVRAFLLKVSDQKYFFGFVAHHVLCDAFSIMIAEREISLKCKEYVSGRIVKAEPAKNQYLDYMERQHDWLMTKEGKASVAHWESELSKKSSFLIPPDVVDLKKSEYGELTFRINDDLFVSLTKLRKEKKIGANTFFIAAQAAVINMMDPVSEPSFKVVHFGRDSSNFGIIGPMAYTHPIKFNFEKEVSFLDLLDLVQKSTNSIQRVTRALPTKLIYGMSSPSFNFVDLNAVSSSHFWGASVKSYYLPKPQNNSKSIEKFGNYLNYKLTIYNEAEKLIGALIYSADMYHDLTIRLFAAQVLAFLSFGIEDPGARVDVLLEKAEQEKDKFMYWLD